MADICMCEGKDCPLKENCYRFKAKPNNHQSYFIELPYKDDKCEMYWPLKKETKNPQVVA